MEEVIIKAAPTVSHDRTASNRQVQTNSCAGYGGSGGGYQQQSYGGGAGYDQQQQGGGRW